MLELATIRYMNKLLNFHIYPSVTEMRKSDGTMSRDDNITFFNEVFGVMFTKGTISSLNSGQNV